MTAAETVAQINFGKELNFRLRYLFFLHFILVSFWPILRRNDFNMHKNKWMGLRLAYAALQL